MLTPNSLKSKKTKSSQTTIKETLTTAETAKLWGMGYNLARELINTLYFMKLPVGLRTLNGWKISRKKAIEALENGDLQKAYDKIKGIYVPAFDD